MELIRLSYAVVYVILLCALAQGGSEGKGGKEEEISIDGGGAFSSSIYVHGIKVKSRRRSRYLRTQTRGGKGRWQQRTRRNWRDDADITSFYFTRFSEEVTKAELWRHFSQWGELKEIFIPNRRNREGKRYGFARFKGVHVLGFRGLQSSP